MSCDMKTTFEDAERMLSKMKELLTILNKKSLHLSKSKPTNFLFLSTQRVGQIMKPVSVVLLIFLGVETMYKM